MSDDLKARMQRLDLALKLFALKMGLPPSTPEEWWNGVLKAAKGGDRQEVVRQWRDEAIEEVSNALVGLPSIFETFESQERRIAELEAALARVNAVVEEQKMIQTARGEWSAEMHEVSKRVRGLLSQFGQRLALQGVVQAATEEQGGKLEDARLAMRIEQTRANAKSARVEYLEKHLASIAQMGDGDCRDWAKRILDGKE